MNSVAAVPPPSSEYRLRLPGLVLVAFLLFTAVFQPLWGASRLHPPDVHHSTPHAAPSSLLKEVSAPSLPTLPSESGSVRPAYPYFDMSQNAGREFPDPIDHPPR